MTWATRSWGLQARLFALSVAVVVVGLAVAQWSVSAALRRHLDVFTRAQLAKDARLAATAMSASGAWRRGDALMRELARSASGRVTLIDPGGVVRADSALDAERVAQTENHGDRPEVIAARRDGQGFAMRRSDTLGHELLYAAARVEGPGGLWVVRVAVSPALSEDAAEEVQRLARLGALAGVILAALMSAIAASLASRPLRQLTQSARAMVGDLSVRTRLRQDDEVGALAQALDALADGLAASMRSLALERDRLGAILEAMAEGVLVTDHQGFIALANRAARESLPLSPDALGRPPIEALRNAELHELFEAVRAGRQARTREIAFELPTPRRMMVRVTALDGSTAGLTAVFTDVTELRRLETMRRDFVANVSHELRTPVAAIRAAAETLLLGAMQNPETTEEFVSVIERQGERLHRLVEDLLELSRLESGAYPLQSAALSLGAEVHRALELTALSAEQRGTTLSSEVPPGLRVRADRRALEQVLVNLIDNAIKYSGEGAAVSLEASRHGARVRLTVRDTGPGIEARHLPRLFERFYRVDTSRSRAVGGTGLGLAIVKHLCEVMGATVRVESEPGRGTRFHVDLAAADEAAE